jgi:two-component system, sensor histidine kinase and response regulator
MVIVQDKTSQLAFEKLKNNNEMIKMQTSCVSHDMRAPLSAITCMVDAILRMKGVSDKIVQLLRPVRCASKILNVQINNLLDYSLMQLDRFKVNPSKFDILELIETITDVMRPQAELSKVEIIVNVAQEVPSQVFLD